MSLGGPLCCKVAHRSDVQIDLAPYDIRQRNLQIAVNIHNFRPATGVLSNIDHKQKNPNIDQISTTQHFIDQISTAKFT